MNTTLILSYVVAISTALYTLLNIFMLRESYKTRKQKIEPLLIGFLKSSDDHSVLNLHIKNVGVGLAKNVKIKLIKDYNQFDMQNHPLSNIGIFKHGISIFPPNYELKIQLHQLTQLNADDIQSYIEFEITCDRIDNTKIKSHFLLRFKEIMGLMYATPPLEDGAKIPYYLKKISENLENKNLKIQEF